MKNIILLLLSISIIKSTKVLPPFYKSIKADLRCLYGIGNDYFFNNFNDNTKSLYYNGWCFDLIVVDGNVYANKGMNLINGDNDMKTFC